MSGSEDSEIEANLTVGPTDQGMVRVLVEGDGFAVPMDFDPQEADEIAEELRAAAAAARTLMRARKPRSGA